MATSTNAPCSLETPEFVIQQTRKGCVQELFGCTANSQFYFFTGGEPWANEIPDAMLEEQSSCCIRFFCKGIRFWDTKMVSTDKLGGKDYKTEPLEAYDAMYYFHRPLRCQPGLCKCCCYQEVSVETGVRHAIGGVREGYYYCMPRFNTLTNMDDNSSVEYTIHMPSCCGGMCVNCCAQGCCNCRIPFLVYKPGGKEEDVLKSTGSKPVPKIEGTPDAQICKVWAGLKSEFLTDADTFEVKTPDGCTEDGKARLFASVLLLNQLFFERDSRQE
jgi:hypothetical protein